MAGNVFEEDPSRLHLSDDPGNVWPEVALVLGPFALTRLAERLAGISSEDGVDAAAQLASVECGDVVPDGRGCEISCALRCNDCSSGIGLPLDKCSRVKARLGQHESHIEATGARAK